jgi:hypothetical protein
MEPGRANLRPDAAACRAACAEDARCTAWLWCARPGGCDDGQVWTSILPAPTCSCCDTQAICALNSEEAAVVACFMLAVAAPSKGLLSCPPRRTSAADCSRRGRATC